MEQIWMNKTWGRLNCRFMPCRRAHSLLEEYAHGDLPSATENAVAKHLNRCATCQADYETMFTIRCVLDTYPRIEASPHFNQQVWQRVATRRMPVPSRLDRLDSFFVNPLYKLAGSTALGLALAGLLVGAVLLPGLLARGTVAPQAFHGSDVAAMVTADNSKLNLGFAAGNNLPAPHMSGSYADWMRALQQPAAPLVAADEIRSAP